MLATFPAVNGVNCIVVGTVANTGRSVTNWMITLLHEHFHQYVNTQPNHFYEVNNLNLSGGDQTGMWMLNYPFPYDSLPVIKQYEKLSAALLSSIQTIGKKTFRTNYSQYRLEKKSFSKMVKPNDYKYFCFQVWQEGLAGYTEYKFIQLLKSYAFPSDILQIEGFMAMEEYSSSFYKAQIKNLQELILPEHKRICVYGVGFAEGLLLDTINPDWRKLYFKNKFSTDSYYTKTK